jgi:hypothetical protein
MKFTEVPPNSSTLNTEQEQEEEEEDEENNVKQEGKTFSGCSAEQETKASGYSKKPQESNDAEHKGVKSILHKFTASLSGRCG